jgi:predicted negative regulator of RcsB-dependent stress response
VIGQPTGIFTEKSLLNAAISYYNLKQYDKAMVDYENLEKIAKAKENIVASLAGQLRSSNKLNDCEVALDAAKKVLESDLADKDLQIEAHLVAGKCYLSQDKLAEAKSELSVVAKRTNSEMTAESKYLLAFIEYKLTNYKESQKLILEIQKQNPSYDFWIAKGFILVGDIYLAQKDTFQARETYKSIVDNYEKDPSDPEDLKQVAREKMLLVSPADVPKTNTVPADSTDEQIK